MNDTEATIDRENINHLRDTELQSAEKDNLCLILGIKKSIEYLLNQKEIKTFEQLSNCSPSFILSITNKVITAHSNTWPHQALLAKKSKWKALVVYQYHIKLKTAGRLAYDEI